jgi:hypothetical protein
MKRVSTTILAGLFSAALAAAQMQPVLDTVVTDKQGDGCIDWTNRIIYAKGIGAPNPDQSEAAQRPGALRAAQMIALRNALEALKGIYLNSSTTVENFMVKSDVITSKVSGFVRGFEQKGKEKYMSDGSVELVMAIPLDGVGGIGDMLLGASIGEKPSVTIFEGAKSKKAMVFTGLIIDCRGLNVKPALAPKILDESGKEVYGSAYVSRDWAIKYGIVGYAKDVKAAAKLDRVGKTPGQIKALKAQGDNATDVVISDTDAADVRSAAQNLKFLSECRVILVVD